MGTWANTKVGIGTSWEGELSEQDVLVVIPTAGAA